MFAQREFLDDTVYIPLRLIATSNEEVVAAIVKATNRQTEVRQEQLIALSDFQKKIEAYFLSFEPSKRLFYERRSRQFGASIAVEKTRIITPTSLIRSYASIFLEEPHRTTRSYKLLLDRVGKDIFGAEHRLEPYYFAASAQYRLEYAFRNTSLESKFKPARYHILLAARILLNPGRAPKPNSHDMAKYSDAMTEVLWNTSSSEADKVFLRAAEIVSEVAKGDLHRDRIRTEACTDDLIHAAQLAAR